jgi:hypothetical protein
MKAVPLFDTTAPLNAWHNVRAPGGYEQWRFDADDLAGNTQLMAIFSHGDPFDPRYRSAVQHYRRRPTVTPPPQPADYCAVELMVIQNGRLLHKHIQRLEAGSFTASRERFDVSIGMNRAQERDGVLRLTIEGSGLHADLTFAPVATRSETVVPLSRGVTGGDHRWTLAHPRCSVRGIIKLPPVGNSGFAQTMSFEGRGAQLHALGAGPIAGMRRWLRGRILTSDRTLYFSHATAGKASRPEEPWLASCSDGGIDVTPMSIDFSDRRRVPSRITIDERIVLGDPTLIDAANPLSRLRYTARVGDETVSALVDVHTPRGYAARDWWHSVSAGLTAVTE